MKVIFLDHDGVICLSNNWGGRTKKWAKWEKATGHTIAKAQDNIGIWD